MVPICWIEKYDDEMHKMMVVMCASVSSDAGLLETIVRWQAPPRGFAIEGCSFL